MKPAKVTFRTTKKVKADLKKSAKTAKTTPSSLAEAFVIAGLEAETKETK